MFGFAKKKDLIALTKALWVLQDKYDELSSYAHCLGIQVKKLEDALEEQGDSEKKIREGLQNILDYSVGTAREAVKP